MKNINAIDPPHKYYKITPPLLFVLKARAIGSVIINMIIERANEIK